MMPNPWKRSKISSFSRFVSGLGSKRPPSDSPLLVQTGFPTSLADLVVKHRSRLRSRRHRPPTLASFASQITDAVEATQHRLDDEDSCSTAEILSEDPPQATASPEEQEKSPVWETPSSTLVAEITPGRGVGCQAKVVLVMALAVCTKELVLGVMVSALTLLLLESVGSRILAWSIPRRSLPQESVGLDIRHTLNSESDAGSRILKGRIDLGREETEKAGEIVISKVKKKHWRKAVAERFRGSKRRKDAKEPALDRSSSSSESSLHSIGGDSNEDEELDERDCTSSEAYKEEDKMHNQPNGCSSHVFLLIVALSGLAGGKLVALVVTVACCYLMRTAGLVKIVQKI